MSAPATTAISIFAQSSKGKTSDTPVFLDEDLTAISATRIPEEFRKLSGFVAVVVLIPKSVVRPDKGGFAVCKDMRKAVTPLDAAEAWLRSANTADTFVFGEVSVNFTTMETHRRGRTVVLTCKQFKTLEYFIKNARRVVSRDELLNEVWGYQNYPCTRTVDNHLLQLRRKLETEPARPKHFHTVHGFGYKFVP